MTKLGRISKVEATKSLRDAVVVGLGGLLGYLVPTVLDIFAKTDFGEYNMLVAAILALLSPFLNRLLNGWRIKQ